METWPKYDRFPLPAKYDLDTRAGRNDRLVVRNAANSPWPAKVAQENRLAAKSADKALERETGLRMKVSCIIPVDLRKPSHHEVLKLLEFNLMMQFGGYTQSKVKGGWLNDQGDFVRDSSLRYEVSFEPCEKKAEKVISFFTEAGKALGEQWLHIEKSKFLAEHRKVG